MNEDILDLSKFHLTRPSGKPYAVFDPRTPREYDKLYELLHIAEVKETILAEALQIVERDNLDLSEPWQAARIYHLEDMRDAQTDRKLKLKDDAGLYVLMQIMLKEDRYTSLWVGFLCPENGVEVLAADQQSYFVKSGKYLKLGHQQTKARDN